MVLVLDMELVLAMVVLDMELLLDIMVVAMPAVASKARARGLLMPSLRLTLVCIMEDMDMVPVLAMLDLDMDILVLDMPDILVMEDMVLHMAVPSMVNINFCKQKLKSNLIVIQCPLLI